jgi:hypothetical protein
MIDAAFTRRAFAASAILASLALVGCGTVPASSPEEMPFAALLGPRSTNSTERFSLEVRTSRATYSDREPIRLGARLKFNGPGEATTLEGLGVGLVLFDIHQVDGAIQLPAVWPDECREYELQRGQSYDASYAKSGSFDEGSPDRPFYRTFFNDPELSLPAGQWRITARVEAREGSCGGDGEQIDLVVSLMLSVTSAADPAGN